jgi:hypothetical protein
MAGFFILIWKFEKKKNWKLAEEISNISNFQFFKFLFLSLH